MYMYIVTNLPSLFTNAALLGSLAAASRVSPQHDEELQDLPPVLEVPRQAPRLRGSKPPSGAGGSPSAGIIFCGDDHQPHRIQPDDDTLKVKLANGELRTDCRIMLGTDKRATITTNSSEFR